MKILTILGARPRFIYKNRSIYKGILNYLQFKQAAKKHYFTCKCLYEKCNSNWQVQENIFYLCGYIVEMMLKYQFFKRINYDRYKDIKNLNFSGITYDSHIKSHNIRTLVNLLKRYESALILDKLLISFENWKFDIRYNV